VPEDEVPALKPKVPGACALCDKPCREVVRLDPRTRRVLQWGRRDPSARYLRLQHRDGSFSEHTICAACDPKPADLPVLWKRAGLLYMEECSGRQMTDGTAERFVRNLPLGILEIA